MNGKSLTHLTKQAQRRGWHRPKKITPSKTSRFISNEPNKGPPSTCSFRCREGRTLSWRFLQATERKQRGANHEDESHEASLLSLPCASAQMGRLKLGDRCCHSDALLACHTPGPHQGDTRSDSGQMLYGGTGIHDHLSPPHDKFRN